MSDLKSFTSWKLSIINAVSMDARLSPLARTVAVRLLQHSNSDTRAIFPSQRTVAIEIGCSPQAVKLAIRALTEAGWVRVVRADKRKSNRYLFATEPIASVLLCVEDALSADTLRVRNVPIKSVPEGTGATPQRVHSRTLVRDTPHTPIESPKDYTPEGNNLNNGPDAVGHSEGSGASKSRITGLIVGKAVVPKATAVTVPSPQPSSGLPSIANRGRITRTLSVSAEESLNLKFGGAYKARTIS